MLIVVLDCIRKAQNLAAVMRLMAATNADVYLTGDVLRHDHRKVKNHMQKWARLNNPDEVDKIVNVRYVETLQELIKNFRSQGYRIIGTTPSADTIYTELDYSRDDFVLIFGPEVSGLSQEKLDMLDVKLRIPMRNDIDSLNLTNSVSIILYEALRQQGFKF
ncbi:hypothetical protein GF312_05690 [Candidatus Poribacteria bacterium]|nr:hypothetical protein [Candidatus Poribacteria bacterium]